MVNTIIFGLSNIFYLKFDVVEGCVFGVNLMRVLFSTRYGHFNLISLKFMHDAGMVEDMSEIQVSVQTCENCELGKQYY